MPINLLTISQEGKKQGLSISPIVTAKMTNLGGPTSVTWKHNVLYLNELRIRRMGMPLSLQAYYAFQDPMTDPLHVIQTMQDEYRKLLGEFNKSKIFSLQEAFNDSLKGMESTDSEILLSTYSIEALNELVIGCTAGDNTIIAGRPGSGKTAFVMQELRHMALQVPVGLISLEMTKEQIMYREISALTGYSMRQLITKKGMTKKDIEVIRALENTFTKNFYIVDNLTHLKDLNVTVLKMVEYHGVLVWGLDYLQLLQNDSKYGSRQNDVQELSQTCKMISKSTKTHGLILSQLNRESEKGKDVRKPRLSDLKDSGAIEADATNVLFIYRPESQGVTEGPKGEDLKGKAQIIVAKSRNGKLDDIEVKFDGSKYKFYESDAIEPGIQEEIPY